MLALRRLSRYGLIFIDGHLDFRHPGNAQVLGAAAGEDLALVTGRGEPPLTNLEGQGPLVQESDVVAIGFRPGDECAAKAQHIGMTTIAAAHLRQEGSSSNSMYGARVIRAEPCSRLLDPPRCRCP
jgi:arginase